MADFEVAVTKTIANEGGDKYTETPDDKGGSTKFGISLRFLYKIFNDQGLGFFNVEKPVIDCLKNLTLEQAKFIYKEYFWDANRYGEIEDQDIANKVFDMSVLIGASEANKILQKSEWFDGKDIDGIIGNKTLKHINSNESFMLCEADFKLHCIQYFLDICNKDQTQEKFLLGWLNRVMS